MTILREQDDEKVRQALFLPGTAEIMTALLPRNFMSRLAGDWRFKVWDRAGARVVHKLERSSEPGQVDTVGTADVSPDGRTIIVQWTGIPSSTFVIYDDYREVWRFRLPFGELSVIWFGPGLIKMMVGPRTSNTVTIFDLTHRSQIAMLSGHTGSINGGAFSPDGRRAVTESHDHTIRLWDAESGAEIADLPDERDHGPPVFFSPDGSKLVKQNSDTDRTILVNLHPAFFIPYGARRDYVCRESLVGAETFNDLEMSDPSLRGREDIHNPCVMAGPLDLQYYQDLFAKIRSGVLGATGS